LVNRARKVPLVNVFVGDLVLRGTYLVSIHD
jgi:hypothetical protein